MHSYIVNKQKQSMEAPTNKNCLPYVNGTKSNDLNDSNLYSRVMKLADHNSAKFRYFRFDTIPQ